MRTLAQLLVAFGIVACGTGDTAIPGGEDSPGIAQTEPPSSPPPPTTNAPPPAPPAPTTPPGSETPPVVPKTASACFAAITGAVPGPDYDQFGPKVLPSCAGTNHQSIQGVEKVVFLGDSVTVGTPPTKIGDFYASRLAEKLRLQYGAGLEVKSCADWGARTDDLLAGKNQIERCWPNGTETKRTLVVMTNGGNDIAAWAQKKLSTAEAMTMADDAAQKLRDAIDWMHEPGRFANGVYVAFANVYEYTDTSGDLASCPAAGIAGFSGAWPEGRPAVVHLQEQYMKIAVETKTDMVFLLETFCGHGYKKDDPTLQCYRGPNTPRLFDLTCIHPTPEGHAKIAELFEHVIDGT